MDVDWRLWCIAQTYVVGFEAGNNIDVSAIQFRSSSTLLKWLGTLCLEDKNLQP
jgi:hypothetical protein